jgi:single-strand DNA-binding protein
MYGTLNKVTLIGHLGDDVKIHYFEGGNCIARFSIATNEVYINKSTNEKITSTEWHNLVFRNKAAELCEKYLSKGDKIYVEGKIRTRHWQTEEGITKHTTEIQVTEFIFLQTRKDLDAKTKNLKHSVDDKLTNFEVPKISDYDNLDELPF